MATASYAQVEFSNGATAATNEQQVFPNFQQDFVGRKDHVWVSTVGTTTTLTVRDLGKTVLLSCTDVNGALTAAFGRIVLPAPSLSVGGRINLRHVHGSAADNAATLVVTTPSGFFAGSVKVWQTESSSSNAAANGSSHQTLTLVGPLIGTRVNLLSTGGLWVVDGSMPAYGATTTAFS
jgi:hypothetical protein